MKRPQQSAGAKKVKEETRLETNQQNCLRNASVFFLKASDKGLNTAISITNNRLEKSRKHVSNLKQREEKTMLHDVAEKTRGTS